MMMSEEEFIESQKDCARMLGMTLEEYEDSCKNIKISKEIINAKNIKSKDDYKFFKFLGLTSKDLKRKKSY